MEKQLRRRALSPRVARIDRSGFGWGARLVFGVLLRSPARASAAHHDSRAHHARQPIRSLHEHLLEQIRSSRFASRHAGTAARTKWAETSPTGRQSSEQDAPVGARCRVAQLHAALADLGADGVGLGEVLRLAGRDAGGDALLDPCWIDVLAPSRELAA